MNICNIFTNIGNIEMYRAKAIETENNLSDNIHLINFQLDTRLEYLS